MDSLSAWLLAHYGSEQFTPGLGRIQKAIGPLKDKLMESRIVTVAGTNGKGETVLRLSGHLQGKTFCTWTSPHIQRITERFRSEAGEISIEELETLIKEGHREVEERGLRLTYYEFLFFVFCRWAHKRSPEFLLLEVGLGGRLDAVNVLDAQLVLLPSISRDHQEYLGNRYDLILQEKLGVLRPGTQLLSCLELNYLRERAQKMARGLGAEMIDLFELRDLSQENFTRRNQLLARAAWLWLTGRHLSQLEWTLLEGPLEHRGEEIQAGAEWTFFGSHNVDGVRKLIQFLGSGNYNLPRTSFDVVLLAFSQRPRQDLSVMLRMMKSSGLKNLKVTCFNHPKAAPREQVEGLARQEGLEFVEDVDSFVQEASGGRVLVTGSYYFLGHLKSLLGREFSPVHSRR